jgi:glycosyltransferase involved in cell wall biosynthesis
MRARLWQVFYFAEAVMVWASCRRRDTRHLHAHLANVAADVAWLACTLGNAVEPIEPGPAERHPAEGHPAERHPAERWRWSFTMHGCIEFWEVERFNLARKVAAADLVVCISDFTRAQLMAHCPPEHWSKLRVVHCGVDLDRYHSRPAIGAQPATVELLAVGRLSPEKGQLVLLDAFAEVRKQLPPVHLTIVGDGPLRDELVEHARALGVEHAVTFAGAIGQDAMPGFFTSADVFCQPSFAEGIPVVLMEAMASGLPVVTSGVAGIPELVDDGRSGILVPPGRADLLAAALCSLVRAPALRAQMGQAGRAKVERSFDAVEGARAIARAFAEMRER